MSDLGDRYVVVPLYNAALGKLSGKCAIEDIGENEYVKEDRRSPGTGKVKRFGYWKGTKEDADAYCALLNKDYRERHVHARSMADDLARSQIIHYANERDRRRSVRPRVSSGPTSDGTGGVAGFRSPFRRCDGCGLNVRDPHTCA